MRKASRATLVLAIAIAAGGVTVTAAQAGGSSSVPPAPHWVNAGGTVGLDRSATLVEVAVVGSDGRLVTNDRRQVKKVLLRVGEVPPPPRGG